jgi:hypothetical protein
MLSVSLPPIQVPAATAGSVPASPARGNHTNPAPTRRRMSICGQLLFKYKRERFSNNDSILNVNMLVSSMFAGLGGLKSPRRFLPVCAVSHLTVVCFVGFAFV